MKTIKIGDRVQTPGGPGTVVSQRMAPPDYSAPATFSVRLDARAGDARYVGTIYMAAAVSLLEPPPDLR